MRYTMASPGLLDPEAMRAETKREEFPDFCKGVLISLVVFGHAIQYIVLKSQAEALYDPVFSAIYMFHMPLFMALSGFFATPAKVGRGSVYSVGIRRARQLLAPMLTWVVLATLVHVTLDLMYHDFSVIEWIKYFVKAIFINYWFIWAVFLSYMALRFLLLIPIRIEFSVIIAAIIMAILPFNRIPLFGQTLAMFSFMFPFFCAGSFLGSRYEQGRSPSLGEGVKYAVLACSAGVAIALYLRWSPVNYIYVNGMDILQKPIPVLGMLIAGACASILALQVVKWLYHATKRSVISSQFIALGNVTLQIYLAQGVAFVIIGMMSPRLVASFSYQMSIVIGLVLTGLMLFALKSAVKYSEVLGASVFRWVWGIEPRASRA